MMTQFFPTKKEYHIEGSFSGIDYTSCLQQQFKVVKTGQSLWPTRTQLSYQVSITPYQAPSIIPIVNFSCKFLHLRQAWVLRGPLPHPPYKAPVGTERSISPRMEERGRSRSRLQMLFFSLSLSTIKFTFTFYGIVFFNTETFRPSHKDTILIFKQFHFNLANSLLADAKLVFGNLRMQTS